MRSREFHINQPKVIDQQECSPWSWRLTHPLRWSVGSCLVNAASHCPSVTNSGAWLHMFPWVTHIHPARFDPKKWWSRSERCFMIFLWTFGLCNVRVFQPEPLVPEHLRFASKGPGFHVEAAPTAVATNVAESPNVPAPFKQSVALRLWQAYFNKIIPKTEKLPATPSQALAKMPTIKENSVFPKVRILFRYAGFVEYMLIFGVRSAEQLFVFKNSHSNKRQAEQWLPLTAPAAVVTSRTSRRSASTTFAPGSWKKLDHQKPNWEWNLEMICTWNPKQSFFNRMFGETTIYHFLWCNDFWNHPIE